MKPIDNSTFAERLTHEYATDDIKVAGVLKALGEDDKLGGLLDFVAYGYKTGDWTQAVRWIDGAVEDAVTEAQAANDARLDAELTGECL